MQITKKKKKTLCASILKQFVISYLFIFSGKFGEAWNFDPLKVVNIRDQLWNEERTD
jgi:hypothetical protein